MFSLFFTPQWFSGWDLAFDAVGILVAFLIAAFSWRIYRINRENKFAYFSFAFLLISIAFLFKILALGLNYYIPLRNVATQVLIPFAGGARGVYNYSGLLYRAGFFFWMVTTLGAWLLLFFVSQKKEGRHRQYYEVSQIALFVYLLVLISIVANFKYFVFFLTSSVILSLTVLNYYKNYLNTNRNTNAFRVMLAFLFLLAGNLCFVFVFLSQGFYVLGEILLLLGFLVLLYTYGNIARR